MGVYVKKGNDSLSFYRIISNEVRKIYNIKGCLEREMMGGKGIATSRCWISPPAYKKGIEGEN